MSKETFPNINTPPMWQQQRPGHENWQFQSNFNFACPPPTFNCPPPQYFGHQPRSVQHSPSFSPSYHQNINNANVFRKSSIKNKNSGIEEQDKAWVRMWLQQNGKGDSNKTPSSSVGIVNVCISHLF